MKDRIENLIVRTYVTRKGEIRHMIDPLSIPERIRNKLCKGTDWWAPSAIGNNHHTTFWDSKKQGWRDMRNERPSIITTKQVGLYDALSGTIEV